ncbi:MAG: hypothetical protein WC538_19430 [Thermoanaerobaculia bacterium]|jgi:hypothetical protein
MPRVIVARATVIVIALLVVTLPAFAQPRPGSPAEREPKTPRELERQIDNVWKRDQATSRYELPPLESAVYKQTIEDFHAGHADVVEDLRATWGEYLSGTGEYFIALQLSRAAGGDFVEGTNATLFGEVLDAAGKQVVGFQTTRPLAASNGVVYTDLSLKLAPSSYTATVGLATGGTPRSMVTTKIGAEPIDPRAFGVSRLLLSDDIHPLTVPQKADDPFAFGGLKVVPRGDLGFTPGRELWLFLVVRNPGLDAAKAPSIRARVVLNGPAGATSRKKILPVSDLTPTPLQGFDKHWGLGIPLDTSKLAAGDYSVSLELTDTLLSRTWSAGEQFRIVEP